MRLCLKVLEDRRLLSACAVTTTADSGPGSLRDAITQINADVNLDGSSRLSHTGVDPTRDEIDFNITAASDTGGGFNATTGVATIEPLSPLPELLNTAIIDGYTQPGATPNTLLGPGPLGQAPGDHSQYGDNAVLKVELDGESAGPTSGGLALGGSNIIVQGLVINRFKNSGITIEGTNTLIAGNFIGTDVDGTAVYDSAGGHLGNVRAGIEVQASGATIGGGTPAARNVISGSWNPVVDVSIPADGVLVDEVGGTIVQGNFIGTDRNGLAGAIGNQRAGVFISGGGGNQLTTIGGAAAGQGNVISGNGVDGIGEFGFQNDVVTGNFIGTNVTGTAALGNGRFGIGLDFTGTVTSNLISGNGGDGINGHGSGIQIQSNFIGADVTGQGHLVNGDAIEGTFNNSCIGGIDTNRPGDPLAGGGNLVEGDIDLYGGSADVVEGNYIATTITGTEHDAGRQFGFGVYIGGGTGITVGGVCPGTRNVIVGSGDGVGIRVDSASAGTGPQDVIEGNYIGVDATGTHVLGRFDSGVDLMGSSGCVIGGLTQGACNVIAGCGVVGVALEPNGAGAQPSQNLVEGNYIGTDATGLLSVDSNGRHFGNGGGIMLDDATDNVIGGETAGAGNTVAFNIGDGVWVESGTGNSILGNSIHDNTGLGIDLNSATNANDNQAAPVLTAAYAISGSTIVTGTLAGAPGTTAVFHLEFFANAASDAEGRSSLGSWDGAITFDASGHGSFPIVMLAPLPAGEGLVTATATDPAGNTSEFSAGVTATPLPPSSLSGVVWEDFNNDGQVDFGEAGISGVTVTLTGTDLLGNTVNLPPQVTNSDGAYVFLNLLPGNYNITETQPAGYLQGTDTVGTAGGSLVATDEFFVSLAAGVDGLNYNFGELPAAGGSVQHGQTAGIGFWNNKNGQALIKALPVVTNTDGSVTSIANWLAATLPNIFGANSANDLAGQSNASVAALFQHDFILQGVKLDAQVLATALNVYATNATLDSTAVAAQYGFVVSGDGLGTASVNVGGSGDAFGVANNSSLTVIDLLQAADAQAVDGVLYNGNATLRKEANDVFSALNQAGGIN